MAKEGRRKGIVAFSVSESQEGLREKTFFDSIRSLFPLHFRSTCGAAAELEGGLL